MDCERSVTSGSVPAATRLLPSRISVAGAAQQTTLRSVLGQAELDDLLAQRDRLNQELQQILDHLTDPWGVKVSAVEVSSIAMQTA
jgi:regulator of protease activity HflC (stomatin/prohibitin superfamily)